MASLAFMAFYFISVVSSFFLLTLLSLHNASEKAAIVIQSHFRRFIERHNFLKMTKAIGLIQIVTRAWLTVKKNSELNKFSFAGVPEVPSGVYSYLSILVIRIFHITCFSLHSFYLCFTRTWETCQVYR